MRALLLFFLIAATLPAQQHTDGAPAVIEGPQTPGAIPRNPSPDPTDPAVMTNDTVLRMHKAGLTDDLILQTIATQPGRYDTTPNTLIDLKQAGLADPILAAMSNRQRKQITNTPAPINLPPVDEIGVYYKAANGTWQPMESEIVHIKSGGFIKSTLSDGIIKQDRNGTVDGPTAKLVLPAPSEFLLYTPDGTTGDEYQLVLFRLHENRREFRIYTGGIIHGGTGADRDAVPFKPVRIAARTYTFSIPRNVGGGEYGILVPGAGNVTNAGKIYTFAVTE